tara:strand:+ start:1684 stop:2346 length:663 start_codon:yes stop_codon:yes gene_type:complete
MVYIFNVEGNIGSGKSTLVRILEKELKSINSIPIVYVQEPVDEWSTIKDKHGETILEKFYNDQYKYAFSFQMMAYISRLSLVKQIIRDNPNAIIICERSVFTDKEVFAKMLYDDGKIEEVNYQIYLKWFDEFIDDIPVSGIIYVNTSPENSKSRVDFRARPGEDIPLEYLEKCYNYHNNWLADSSEIIFNFDGNNNFRDNITTQSIDNIKDFINQIISSK